MTADSEVPDFWNSPSGHTLSHLRGNYDDHAVDCRQHVEAAMALCDKEVATGLDWGPGGSDVAKECAKLVDRLYAVDVSTESLKHFAKVSPLGQLIQSPEDADTPEPIDLIYSFCVFQHFPDAAYGKRVLDRMVSLASDGAVVCIQVRDFREGQRRPGVHDRPYCARVCSSWCVEADEFSAMLNDAGISVNYVSQIGKANYRWFYGQVRQG